MRAPLIVIAACAFASACAKHVPEPTPHPDTPHISWSVTDDSERQACRSTEASSCTLNMSGVEDGRRLGVFHVFLHAATVDTKYIGSFEAGFLVHSTATANTHSIDRIVERGSKPMNVSVTGFVRPPGTYYVDVDLTATAADGSGKPIPIKTRIRVDIR